MLLAVAAACSSETIEVPGETVVVKEEVIKTVEVPGETVVKEVVKEVMVPGETVVVEKVVTETVEVPGETVVIEKVVTETVEVPGETVTVEVVKEVQVPGETVVVEKEVVKTVEVPGETVVVEKEVVKTVEVPGETVVVEKEVVKTVAGPERVVVKEVRQGYVTDPATGKAVTAPQYGGTLTTGRRQIGSHSDSFHQVGWSNHFVSGVIEKPSILDWAIDRDEWHLASTFLRTDLLVPLIAESWGQPDPLTVVLNVRKGVYWHDKAPMNGRELVAEDFVYNFHRATGLGSGFTEPGEHAVSFGWGPIESITATDKYTVELKLKEDVTGKTFWGGFNIAETIVASYYADIYPPEVIKEHGDAKDWRNIVGTGPLMLADYVLDSAITYEKNPDYWRGDPKYPENRLPYIDQLLVLIMPEPATLISALRTGKVDWIGVPHDSQIKSIDQVESLARTNPEIELTRVWYRSDNSFGFSLTKEPFDDIRVRQAMQMALDHETINTTYFKGYGNPVPQGPLAGDITGYSVPFAEWPEEVRKYYTYDPEGAEALLDAAGLPRGADGIRFKTTLNSTERYDLNYHELVAGYLREIGMQVEIIQTDHAAASAKRNAMEFEGFWAWPMAYRWDPRGVYVNYYSPANREAWRGIDDPQYEALYEAAEAAADTEEIKRLSREMGMRLAEMHWSLWGTEAPQFNANWPWVKGYNGEVQQGVANYNYPLPYLWIDQDLKKAMGY